MPAADSDDEYVQAISDDEGGDTRRVTNGRSTRAGGFEVSRTWEALEEGADGTISGAIVGLLDATKRRRLAKDTTPFQRGIIRHLILVLDVSEAMLDKDLRPSRHLLTFHYAQEFVREYFEQNPISQLGILGMRDGKGERISDMSGNPEEHVSALQLWRNKDPAGNPSLQNVLEMARGALFHAPSHGTREVLVIFGSIYTVDPGDIHETINALVSAKITCTIVGLSAEVAICKTIVAKTNPSINPQAAYSVALDETHFRELFMAATTPPPIAAANHQSERDDTGGSLLQMGFPSKIVTPYASLCACHGQPTREGYSCPRCNSKACSLPTDCRVCGFTLILSTHLARSYHHLFPLLNWHEVSWASVRSQSQPQKHCFGCQAPFPEVPTEQSLAEAEARRNKATGLTLARQQGTAIDHRNPIILKKTTTPTNTGGGISESGRYACPTCHTRFCIDCDVFSHAETHNCPGCLARPGLDHGSEVEDVMDIDSKGKSKQDDVYRDILRGLEKSLVG